MRNEPGLAGAEAAVRAATRAPAASQATASEAASESREPAGPMASSMARVHAAVERIGPINRSDRDLVAALRAELASIDPARQCDREAEAIALHTGSRRASGLARLAIRLGRPSAAAPFDWDDAADHCRFAWLRGLFLARASLSLAGGRAHLEFVVGADDAPGLAARLAELDLPASRRVRRGLGVVTWKNGAIVGTFLRRIGAGAALLELEARQVGRAMRGDLNRVINAESANLQRAVVAAGRQLEAIARLESEGRLLEQPQGVRVIADARRATPESTISELAERMELSRSTVQRALERLERVALHPDDDDDRPRRRSRQAAWRGAAPGRASPAPTSARPESRRATRLA